MTARKFIVKAALRWAPAPILTTLMLALPAPAAGTVIGARIPGAPQYPAQIDQYARAVGRSPAIVSYYREWNEPVFDARSLSAVIRRHGVPMITWEPTIAGWHRGARGTILQTIVDGRADRYLRATARSVPRWPKLILLRFAQEMNGSWSPWGVGTRGNSPALFVAAWRHVVKLFRAMGVRNVSWVWCPNVDDYGSLPFTRLYPGDKWVDWVALDGYNFGGTYGWQSFSQVFASSYNTLARLTAKPMMIAETGSGEQGGNKAAWITSAFTRELPKFSRVAALVWFNGLGDTGTNFRFDSSPAAAAAFRAAMTLPHYAADAASLPQPTAANVSKFVPLAVPPAPKHHSPPPGLVRRYWWAGAGAAALIAALGFSVLRPHGAARRATH